MTDSRPRTAAANDAWRERGAHTAAMKLVPRVTWLSDEDLLSLLDRLLDECKVVRGLPVPEVYVLPRNDEGPPRSAL